MTNEKPPRALRVKIEFVVEVDPDAWMKAYGGSGPDLKSIREDVKAYFGGATVAASAAATECGARWAQ